VAAFLSRNVRQLLPGNATPLAPTAMTATALSGQLPKYIGSTGGWLDYSGKPRRKYAITWTMQHSQVSNFPTGGAPR